MFARGNLFRGTLLLYPQPRGERQIRTPFYPPTALLQCSFPNILAVQIVDLQMKKAVNCMLLTAFKLAYGGAVSRMKQLLSYSVERLVDNSCVRTAKPSDFYQLEPDFTGLPPGSTHEWSL